jgi:CD109 antigen
VQITASGNIVVGDQMEMSGTQKTFSVALSRDMVPSAHIIVYYVDMDEIVASSLNFFVNGSGLNPVSNKV